MRTRAPEAPDGRPMVIAVRAALAMRIDRVLIAVLLHGSVKPAENRLLRFGNHR